MVARRVEDKRGQERISIVGELTGEVTVVERMTVREMSRTGARIETNVPLRLNSLHLFKLSLGDRSVVVQARVVHCQLSDVASLGTVYRSGIEFVDLSQHTADAIGEFVEAMRNDGAAT